MSTYANLAHLAGPENARGADPDLLRAELVGVITGAIANHPRSLQKRIGPSEIGHPCARRLAHKLAGTEAVNDDPAAWRPTVGTAVHSWLQDALLAHNQALGDDLPRWLVEMRVDVGEVGGEVITGQCDLYDRITRTSVDWKIVGPTSLKRYRKDGPGQQYRVQGHTYGRGWVRRGLPVDTVAIAFLPSNGELRDLVWWSEPYDETVALEALTRADGIAALVAAGGRAAPALLPTADAHCGFCPYYLPAATDLTEACPGHKAEDETTTRPDAA